MIKPSFSQVTDSFNIYNTKGKKERSDIGQQDGKHMRGGSKGPPKINQEKKQPNTVRTDSSSAKHSNPLSQAKV